MWSTARASSIVQQLMNQRMFPLTLQGAGRRDAVAEQMKRFWLAAILLSVFPWVAAQESEAPAPSAAQANAAFVIDIQAPDDIKEVLTRHLELQRYRELTDLSDDELERLMRQADQDARKLIGTLGYFSPDITMERQSASASTPWPVVKIIVNPGEAAHQASQHSIHRRHRHR